MKIHSIHPLAAAILAGSLALGTFTAQAGHVEPVVVSGNPDCSSLGYDNGFKIDQNPASGSYEIASTGHFVDIVSHGNSFDWSATLGMEAVIVKGGPVANVYDYDPPEFSDTGLTAAASFGISHVEFCYTDLQFSIELEVSKTAETTFTRTWTWDIEKRVNPDSATVFYGDSHDFDYEVDVTRNDPTDSDWAVSGEISVHNPHPTMSAELNVVSDEISGGIAAAVDCGVSFPFVLDGGATLVCTYSAALPDGQDRLNTATVISEFGIEEGTADVIFGDPSTLVNESVNVTDSLEGSLGMIGDSHVFQYTRTQQCDDDARAGGGSSSENNTATIVETGQSDSATATLNCEDFDADKTANGRFDRSYSWDPAKLVVLGVGREPTQQQIDDGVCMQLDGAVFPGYDGRWACPDTVYVLGDGAPLEPVYLVSLLREDNTDEDGNFIVEGNISYSYPTALAGLFVLGGITDVITFDDGSPDVPVAIDLGGCGSADAGGTTTVSCGYSQGVPKTSLENGLYTGGTNHVDVSRTAQCYDAEGNPKAVCGLADVTESASAGFGFALDGETHACVFAFDLFDGADMSGAVDLLIGADPDGLYCASTSFVVDESQFPPGEYPFVISYADLLERIDEECHADVPNEVILVSEDDIDTTWASNQAVISAFLSAACELEGCTYTRGYWQTHSICGPAAHENTTWDNFLQPGVDKSAVSCFKRDFSEVYEDFGLTADSWLDTLWIPPKGGNQYYILGAQYIAATLNILAGAATTPEVDEAMAYAEAFFAEHTPESAGSMRARDRLPALQAANVLDSYNNGNIGPGHCD